MICYGSHRKPIQKLTLTLDCFGLSKAKCLVECKVMLTHVMVCGGGQMALGIGPILPPAQSRKVLRRMREMEGGRWNEGGRTECGGRLGLKNQAGPVRCEQIPRV